MEQTREHGSVLAAAEKRLLVRIARALPSWISSDQLTVLALAGMAITGAGFVLMRWDPRAVWIPVFGLLVNWFGDSLDGTRGAGARDGTARAMVSTSITSSTSSGQLFSVRGDSAGVAGSCRQRSRSSLLVVVSARVLRRSFLATAVLPRLRLAFAGGGADRASHSARGGHRLPEPHPDLRGAARRMAAVRHRRRCRERGVGGGADDSAARNIAALRRLEPLPLPGPRGPGLPAEPSRRSRPAAPGAGS